MKQQIQGQNIKHPQLSKFKDADCEHEFVKFEIYGRKN